MFNLLSSAHLGRRRRNPAARTLAATRPLRFENLERRIVLTADIVGGGSFATIQQAINNAAPGDQINITPGIYLENVDLSGMGSAIGQGPGDLTLRGTGAGVTINPAAGRVMINSSAFAGDLTIDTIGVTSQTDTGLDLDQYSGTLNILNSNFNTNQENGIELSNATGTITIVDSQVIDMGNKGIRLEAVENVLIDNVTIDGGSAGDQDGIFGRGVSGIVIRNSSFRFIGNNVAHDAIDLKDTSGTVLIRDNSFDQIADDAVQIEANGNVQAIVTVSGNSVTNNTHGGGIEVRTFDDAILNVTISGNTLAGLNDHAIELTVKGASQQTAFVSDNTATNIGVSSAFIFETEDSSNASIVAKRNSIGDTDGNGIRVDAKDTSELEVQIRRNSLSEIGDSTSDHGIQLQSHDSATLVAVVDHNLVGTVLGDAYQLNQLELSVFDIVGVEATATEVVENNNAGTPVTVTGTINVVAPPPSFVDADNDGRFTAGVDIALELGEISDGSFDTGKTEGGYTTVIAGAGLVINGASITGGGDLKYSADGDLVVNTDLTAGDDIRLTSRAGSVLLDDPTLTAPDEIEIKAALDILSTDDLIKAAEVELKAGRDIRLFGTSVEAVREVELKAGESIIVGDSFTPLPGSLTASDPTRGEVEIKAGLDIDVSGAEIRAGKEVELKTGRDIFAIDAVMAALGSSKGEVELNAAGDIFASDATLQANKEVELKSTGGQIHAPDSTFEASTHPSAEVELKAAGNINVDGATLNASDEIEVKSTGGSILAADAAIKTTASSSEVELKAGLDILANAVEIVAGKEVEVKAGGAIFAEGARMEAVLSSKGEVELKAAGDIFVPGATFSASDEIELKSTGGSIDATAAFFTADEVELKAALDLFFCKVNVSGDLETKWTTGFDDNAC